MAEDKNIKNTIQVIPEPQLGATDSIEQGIGTLVLQLSQASKNFIPFGTAIRARDEQLRRFWKTEPFLSGAITSIILARSSLSWELTGPPKSVNQTQKIFKNSDFGRGWQSLMAKVVLDLLCLAGSTKVHLGGDRLGQTKTISKIVKEKDVGPVLSIFCV